MSARPIKANEVVVKDITFSDVRTNKAGGKTIYINNSDRGSLFIQTPELEILLIRVISGPMKRILDQGNMMFASN